MEESIVCGGKEEDRKAGEGFSFLLEDAFHLKKRDFSQYSPLTLAYVGDAVYELVIRTLMGYLYLREEYQRMIDLISLGLEESGYEL